MRHVYRVGWMVVCVALLVAGCDESDGGHKTAVDFVDNHHDEVVEVGRIVVAPLEVTLAVHEERLLQVDVWDDANNVIEVEAALRWTSEDEGVAVVDGAGRVLGLGAGQTEIVVTAGSVSARVAVTVRALEYRAVAVGAEHSCAVTWSGEVYCWGSNFYGERGDGERLARSKASKIVLPEPMASVSAAVGHSCALTREGVAYCWGNNGYGQLGVVREIAQKVPPTALGGPRYQKLVTGDYHTCGLTQDGELYCWGDNRTGALGLPMDSRAPTPKKMAFEGKVTQVWANSHVTCFLDSEERAYCAGYNNGWILYPYGGAQSFYPERVGGDVLFKSLSVGSYTLCGLTTDSVTICWGTENDPARGRYRVDSHLPQPIESEEEFVTLAGSHHGHCGLKEDGQLYCWGSNRYGVLSTDEGGNQSVGHLPRAVAVEHRWSVVEIGEHHSCGIDREGELWCWGANSSGQVGDGRILVHAEPVRVGTADSTYRFERIFSSSMGSCGEGESSSRSRYCWGGNHKQQLGNDWGHLTKPMQIRQPSGWGGWTQVSLGHEHSCAVNGSGAVYCWGSNRTGQIGKSSDAPGVWPVSSVPTGGNVHSSVYAGVSHSCALNTAGRAFCWGLNSSRQLGTNIQGEAVREVVSDEPFVQLALGLAHTCGVLESGAVVCWGDGTYGILGGQPATITTGVPTVIEITSPVVDLKSGRSHACALTETNDLYCWGWNAQGQLGNGSFLSSDKPVQVSGRWASVETGGWVTCARNFEDELYCWGWNEYHQVSPEKLEAIALPQKVEVGFPVREFSVGSGFVCVLDEGGHPYCWGLNSVGELGNDANYYHYMPQPVERVGSSSE